MIISQTPFRISLFGGGTDYPAWLRRHGGAVVGTTINKYCYISVRTLPPFFEHKHRIVYSRIELPQTIGEIQHPAVRAVLQEEGVTEGIEVQHHGDLPARSGMGSSSSFTVGMLNAVRAHKGLMSSADWLAKEAIRVEQDVIGEKVGCQDQIWAAYGGTNRIDFCPDGSFRVTPLVLSKERQELLQSHMMLFFTGLSRTAAQIAEQKINNLPKSETQVHKIRASVDEACAILGSAHASFADLGALMHESWCLKKELAHSVSNAAIDGIYSAAREAGALGGKLLGAGGGGFMLIFASPANHHRIRERLRCLLEVSVEIGSHGSRIVVYNP